MIIFLIIIFGLSQLYAYHSPVKRKKLTSTFGEYRTEHFHNGVDFGGGEQKVYPFAKGEIIYYFNKTEFPFMQYPGPGNFVIVEHPGRLRTYYYHLKENTLNFTNYNVNENTILGITGNTGYSKGIHLHFTIDKNYGKEILNPLFFLGEELTDDVPPIIKNVYIDEKDNHYSIWVKTWDYLDKKKKIKAGIYKLTSYINERKLIEYKFTRLINRNGYKLNGKYKFSQIYRDKYEYFAGSFLKKEVALPITIKVKVEDFYKNSTQKEKILKSLP